MKKSFSLMPRFSAVTGCVLHHAGLDIRFQSLEQRLKDAKVFAVRALGNFLSSPLFQRKAEHASTR